MKLGNAGGNNTGKKYMKITGEEEITPVNQEKYNRYNEWASKSFTDLQRAVQSKFIYDGDTFNETYIKIGMKVLYGGLDIQDYDSYFSRAYYTNYIQGRVQGSKVAATHEPVDQMAEPTEDVYDRHLDSIIPTVTEYVTNQYDSKQASVFIDYFCNDKEHETFRTLSKKHSVTLFYIHKTINGILVDLKNNSVIKTYQYNQQ